MRDIKFRAWDKQYKQMVALNMIMFDTKEINFKGNNGELKSIEHFELMQYTGLKDKNGEEIYEGDILKHYPGFGCAWDVRYSSVIYDGAAFWENHGTYRFVLSDRDQQLEVIGNIYQDSNLLL